MDNKLHIIFTKGLQASGKSTWAEQFIKNNQNYKRINRDSFRHMLSSYTFDNINEDIVTEVCNNTIKALLNIGVNLVIDQMNLNEKQFNKDKQFIQDYCMSINKQVEFEIREFPITLGEALERDSKRSFPIGEKVIKSTWRKYEIECKQLIEKHKPKYPWNGDLPYCIICDIDGTLAHSPNRRIFDFKEVINDELITPVWSILDKYKSVCDIILLSGRGEDCRKETEEWLLAKHVPYTHLYMRKERDSRSDVIIKTELFDSYIRDKYQPIFVIDDRKSVCNMWVEMGLFLFDVSQDPLNRNPF